MSKARSSESVRLVPSATAVGRITDEHEQRAEGSLPTLAISALGVVFGDIGTSPLYALRQCFQGPHGVAATPENVLGLLSLILWALILVVSVKYILFVLRADNRGEGGIIALVALLNPWSAVPGSRRHILMLLGLFGAALLYGDGTITPAISVLSAVEGLGIATSSFDHSVLPITVAILLGLFLVQRHGTSKIGALFGPIMLTWFLILAGLGVSGIAVAPRVLAAFHPRHALAFLRDDGLAGFIVLGTVFLVVTGAEALYADMGHFGRKPIRCAWFALVLPALLLNYFGQGALFLSGGPAVKHPFYDLAPSWGLYPLVALATTATVIASQAVISGTFSLTRQAVQLGQLPRVKIVQTDSEHFGQIYIPSVNWLLAGATIALVLGFRSSGNLASAYGLAVSMDMVITTLLAMFVALRWGWNAAASIALAGGFLAIDVSFFGANLFKIADGGWYPLMVALLVFTLMAVWRNGRLWFASATRGNREPLDDFLTRLAGAPPARVPGTAVFMTGSTSSTPSILIHHLEHNQMLHERVILFTIVTADQPRVPSLNRIEVESHAFGFYRILAHYGFMQSPNVPVALRLCERFGLDIDPNLATYYIGHERVRPRRERRPSAEWMIKLFAVLARNAAAPTDFYRLPPDRVVELGMQVEI